MRFSLNVAQRVCPKMPQQNQENKATERLQPLLKVGHLILWASDMNLPPQRGCVAGLGAGSAIIEAKSRASQPCFAWPFVLGRVSRGGRA